MRELTEALRADVNISVTGMMLLQVVQPGADISLPHAKLATELAKHMRLSADIPWPKENKVELPRQERQLRVNVANISQEVDDVPAVSILLAPVLEDLNLYVNPRD